MSQTLFLVPISASSSFSCLALIIIKTHGTQVNRGGETVNNVNRTKPLIEKRERESLVGESDLNQANNKQTRDEATEEFKQNIGAE